MKTFLATAVLLICQNVFCQEYYFDTLFEYELTNRGSDVLICNSTRKDYTFFCYNSGSILEGTLKDYKNNIEHYYSIKNNDATIEFTYIYSKKVNFEKEPCTVKMKWYDINEVVIDSINKSYEIIEYTNKKKKKIYKSYKMYLKKYSNTFIPTLTYGIFYDFLKCSLFYYPSSYVPYLVEGNFQNRGYKTISKIIQAKKINTVLTLKPEELKFY